MPTPPSCTPWKPSSAAPTASARTTDRSSWGAARVTSTIGPARPPADTDDHVTPTNTLTGGAVQLQL
eukprot:6294343-Pyramimonas_sp.AAC.1